MQQKILLVSITNKKIGSEGYIYEYVPIIGIKFLVVLKYTYDADAKSTLGNLVW